MRIVIAAVLAWSSAAWAGDADDIGKLVAAQAAMNGGELYTDDAALVPEPSGAAGSLTSVLGHARDIDDLLAPPSTTVGSKGAKNLQIALARDGKSAWASYTVTIEVNDSGTPYRVTDVLTKTKKGWRIAVAAWTLAVANDVVNKEAKAGKRSISELEAPNNDASLVAAFGKLASDGLDATAAARKDVVAIGSGPGERTVGGAVLAKAWNAAWAKHVAVKSTIARVLPGGTTGWVAATIELDKKTYKVPFEVFCVFDKSASGDWSLVHIHFAA